MSPIVFYLLLFGALEASSTSEAPAKNSILSRWTESLQNPKNAMDQIEQFFLGGLSDTQENFFYTSGSKASLDKRSALTGEVVWSASLEAPSQGNWAFTDDLALGSDVRGKIYGIDKNSGKVRWTMPSKGLFFSRPLVFGDQSFWVNSLGVLISLRNSDGKWLWQYSDTNISALHLWAHQGPQLFGNLVLAGFPSGLMIAFDPTTGNRVWQESFATAVEDGLSLNEVRAISAKDQYLLASAFGGNTRLWKAAGSSKTLVWEKRMSLSAAGQFDFEKSQVYLSDRGGNLQAIDLETGFIKWTQYLEGGVGTQPSFSGPWVWVATSNGQVYAFDRQTGEPAGESIITGSPVYNPPLTIDGDAIIVSSKGILRRLYVFGKD